MITRVTLEMLKRCITTASPSPLIVAQLDSKGSRFQLSTPRPGAKVVGVVNSRADAECMAALWVWGQALIAEVELWRDHPARAAVEEMQTEKAPPPDTIIKTRAVGISTHLPRRRHSPGRGRKGYTGDPQPV
jgi:hypothetical protein